jgi:hypothetical protein
MISPWFQSIDLVKIEFGLLKFQSSQLSPIWAPKLTFLPIKPLIKLIWLFKNIIKSLHLIKF